MTEETKTPEEETTTTESTGVATEGEQQTTSTEETTTPETTETSTEGEEKNAPAEGGSATTASGEPIPNPNEPYRGQ